MARRRLSIPRVAVPARAAWPVLLVSGVLEAVWASALGASDGLSRVQPTVVFAVALVASMIGLALAMSHLPVSTAYAVWTGIGAALTVLWAMASGSEPVELVRVLLLLGIVAAVTGLKLAPDQGRSGAVRPRPRAR